MSTRVGHEVAGAISTITLDGDDRLNAIDSDVLGELANVLERTAADDSIRCVVLTGIGEAFCVGADINRLRSRSDDITAPEALAVAHGRLVHNSRAVLLLRTMPKVTIAAINGRCAGAGLSLACASDLRYCTRSAMFSVGFMNAGRSGDLGGSWTLPRIVGAAKAVEMYLLSERFDSVEAERIGLVSKVFADDTFRDAVTSIAVRASALAPLAVRGMKENFGDALRLGFAEHIRLEAERHLLCGRSDDAGEAARAFLERRPPRFTGT